MNNVDQLINVCLVLLVGKVFVDAARLLKTIFNGNG